MKVDIVIRSKGGEVYLGALLRSLSENTPRESYRLIVVDDGSDMPLLGTVDGMDDADVVIRNRSPRGAVTATNLGLSASLMFADSAHVIVMDNDTEIPSHDSGWLQRFVSELEEAGESCAAVGATTNFANPPQHILTVPQTYVGDPNPPVPWFVSFCVLMRKEVVARVGLWDERFNPGNWEDTDYAVQLRAAGYTIQVARSVYIHHKGHKTFKDDLHRLLQENHAKMIEKWGVGRLGDFGILPAEMVAKVFAQ